MATQAGDTVRYETVTIRKHEEVVIKAHTLNVLNDGLSRLLNLIEPNTSFLNSTYREDFEKIEAWIVAHMPTAGEVSHE